MNADDLRAWRDQMGYNQKDAAMALGIGKRTLQDYESDRYEIPYMVGLAMAALFHRLAPWGQSKTGG
jgi:DNA-binding XRE family transcriptional regulator